MIIDNLTSTEVYIEKKSLAKIIGSADINNRGLLELDNKNNSLISEVDSGDTQLYRLTKYVGSDSLMLYNPTTKYIQLAKEGDLLNINIDFAHGTKYYIGAKLLTSKSKTNNVFNIDLNGLIPLKVIMDGREIKTYSSSPNSLTILGTDRGLMDIFSEIIVYAYRTANINTVELNVGRDETNPNTSLSFDKTSPSIFEIDYYQYEEVWNPQTFYSGTYFENNVMIEETKCFESLSVTQNLTKTLYRNGFNFANKTKINSIDNTVDLDIFDASEFTDMIQYVGRDEFRMILINSVFGRTVLINNCRVDNGITLVYDKSKNTKKFTVSCGNYIDIKSGIGSSYGDNKYGKGQYGGGDYIHNSHRVGV